MPVKSNEMAAAGTMVAEQNLTRRERFLRACNCEPVSYPPIWLMRQAGRALPEYRALKEKYSFLELVRTPELATEVTLQPIRRFGFDAAILFSDILVIPEAMGQGYSLREAGGVQMEFQLRDRSDIERLSTSGIRDRLDYVRQALQMIKPELKGETGLIGFSGSPWTLANFMLEGGSSPEPKRGLEILRQQPSVYKLLAEKLTVAVTEYLRMQIEAGAEVVQIFDTHGGMLPPELFRAGSGLWIQRIIAGLGKKVPVIVFSKGSRSWNELSASGGKVIGIDHGISMAEAVEHIPERLGVQGNFDPALLASGDPGLVRREAENLLEVMRGRAGWIFNLGHGLPPNASLDCIQTLVETVRRFS
jgi:uroporphyrinogen decarboxylase